MSLISVIVEERSDAKQEGTLGILSPEPRTVAVDTSKLQASLEELTGQVSEILVNLPKNGDLALKTVQVNVEINAEGGFSLIGSAKAGIKGGLTLTFSRG